MKYQTILGAALLSGLLGTAHAELVVIGAPGAAALSKDQVADDKWMHEIKWYVKGVQGAVPK